MSRTLPADTSVAELGEQLLGQRIVSVVSARSGRNNRVHCIEAADKRRYALKFYPRQPDDPRDRLEQEFFALTFLGRHGIRRVPGAIAFDRDSDCAVYDWIDGAPAVNDPMPEDADRLAAFLTELHALRGAEDAGELRNASASFFSAASAIAQFDARIVRLREAAGDAERLRTFLDTKLSPLARSAIDRLATEYARHGLDPAAELAVEARTLSPSDFGLHNCLRDAGGDLAFLDFEYFGWDDPAKMICDAALHPGSAFSAKARRRLLAALVPAFARSDTAFAVRCKLLYPLIGTIWCLIILNDFLPERWARRIMAGETVGQSAVHERQLEMAERLCLELETIDDDLAAA